MLLPLAHLTLNCAMTSRLSCSFSTNSCSQPATRTNTHSCTHTHMAAAAQQRPQNRSSGMHAVEGVRGAGQGRACLWAPAAGRSNRGMPAGRLHSPTSTRIAAHRAPTHRHPPTQALDACECQDPRLHWPAACGRRPAGGRSWPAARGLTELALGAICCANFLTRSLNVAEKSSNCTAGWALRMTLMRRTLSSAKPSACNRTGGGRGVWREEGMGTGQGAYAAHALRGEQCGTIASERMCCD